MLKIPILGDWIIGIEDSRAHAQLRKHYVPLIEEARSAKNDLEVQNLYAEWNHKQTLIEEPNYVEASDRLVRKARGLYVPVPDRPTNYSAASADWQMSNTIGDWTLTVPTYQRLQRDVQVAQRGANDEWRKWVTLLLALAGFVLGLVSLVVKTKQPDPCQRNYYRNDAGACVFALQPPSPVTVQNPSPPPKPGHP